MAWSQPHKGLKAVKALNGPQVQNAVLRAIPQVAWPQSKNTQAFLQLISQPTPPASQPRTHINIVLSAPQRQDWLTNYEKILADFEQFKRNSLSFLFYQSIPLEKRKLSTEETRQWLTQLIPLHSRILKFYLTTNKQDKALNYMLDYIEYGISAVDPYLVPTLRLSTQPLIAPFNAHDFFLYPPEETTLPDPSTVLEGKTIALINDDLSLLEYFEKLANTGILFPGATIHTNGSPMQFLIWFQYTFPKPDIVFTDIQLGQANGYYIAHRLRESGYKGGIIALTSSTEKETYARQLKAAGFDGMISLDDQYYREIPFAQRVTQAAQVYLERAPKN